VISPATNPSPSQDTHASSDHPTLTTDPDRTHTATLGDINRAAHDDGNSPTAQLCERLRATHNK